MLKDVKRKHSRSTMSIVNLAMNQNIRDAQAKAELMMRRRDPYDNSMAREIHQDWYFTGSTVDGNTALALSPETKPTDSKPSPDAETLAVERSEETLSAIKRRFPHYLTSSGSVLSASLEVNDSLVCCVPGERSKSSRLKSGGTDPVWCKDRQDTTSKSCTTMLSTPEVETCWQPLTTAALLEHSQVNTIPVRGIGHQAHGQYSMWRPDNQTHTHHH